MKNLPHHDPPSRSAMHVEQGVTLRNKNATPVSKKKTTRYTCNRFNSFQPYIYKYKVYVPLFIIFVKNDTKAHDFYLGIWFYRCSTTQAMVVPLREFQGKTKLIIARDLVFFGRVRFQKFEKSRVATPHRTFHLCNDVGKILLHLLWCYILVVPKHGKSQSNLLQCFRGQCAHKHIQFFIRFGCKGRSGGWVPIFWDDLLLFGREGSQATSIFFFVADEFAHVGLCPKPFKRTVVVTNETRAPPFLEIWQREKKWWKQTDINDWATFWGQTCAARVLWTQLATRRDFQVCFGEKKIWRPGSSSLRPAFNFLTGWLLLLLFWAGQRTIYSDDSTTSKMFSANCSHWAIQFCWLDRPIAWNLTSPSAKRSRITTSRLETFVSEQSICHHWKLAIVSCESIGRQLSSVNKHLINWLPYRIVFAVLWRPHF